MIRFLILCCLVSIPAINGYDNDHFGDGYYGDEDHFGDEYHGGDDGHNSDEVGNGGDCTK